MAIAESVGTLILSLLVPPFLVFLLTILVLASLGRSLGLRKKYVETLLKVFEDGNRILVKKFGRERLAKDIHDARSLSIDDTTDDEDDNLCNTNVISRDKLVLRPVVNQKDDVRSTREFELSDCLDFIRTGMESIVDDEVTKRFSAEELTSWNFLTRTNCHYEFISVRLTIFWVLGFVMRYFVLLPLRFLILLLGMVLMVVCTYLVGCLPESKLKKTLNKRVSIFCFEFLGGALSLVCTYHNQENVPLRGICVANHTTPIDVLVLACDNTYDLVGQRHGGFIGIFERALSRASAHIWFERTEIKDRFAVARRLKSHVEDPNKPPILIFPEGTCINNTSVMQFKKGTFEVGGIIYPVAIKYDPRFGDAFWNSSKYSMVMYLYMMMTSWAIVCDVWYLPPMTKREEESSIEFANRVKGEIARQGGLVDLVWDGGLKRSAPKKEWKEQYQQEFSRRLKIHNTVDTEKQREKSE